MIATRRSNPPERNSCSSSVISDSLRRASCCSRTERVLQNVTAPKSSTDAPNRIAYRAERRKVAVRTILGRRTKQVSCAAHCFQELNIEPLVDLGSKPADMGFDDVGSRIEVKLP